MDTSVPPVVGPLAGDTAETTGRPTAVSTSVLRVLAYPTDRMTAFVENSLSLVVYHVPHLAQELLARFTPVHCTPATVICGVPPAMLATPRFEPVMTNDRDCGPTSK